ncbi:MAG: tetratricopeptide repeat protein, partial [Woeseiaceae bacterium]
MLLQRFTKPRFNLALLALLVVSGCAGGGATKKSPDSRSAAPTPEMVDGQSAELVVPPQVQTLYEQAVASMAGGDYVDAELRFKEFVLQYPEYPGAYVNLAIIHGNNDNNEAARSVLDAALALNPNHPAALNQLGML